MGELKAGDIVLVNNWGAKFPLYEDWFINQIMDNKDNFNLCWAIRFAYGVSGDVSSAGTEYKVLYVKDDKALITKVYGDSNPVYLIGTSGLMKIKHMTIAEIEKALGYKIKIIGGHDA